MKSPFVSCIVFFLVLALIPGALTLSAAESQLVLTGDVLCGMPIGDYAGVSGVSIGGDVGFGITNAFMDRLYLGIAGEYGYIFADNDVTDSMSRLFARALVGFGFPLRDDWIITPRLGLGAQGHFLKAPDGSPVFWDICASVDARIQWAIHPYWSLDVTPRALFFFEDETVGVFLSGSLGVTRRFNIRRANGLGASVSLDDPLFSPNGDGFKDAVSLRFSTTGSPTSWVVSIQDTSGKTVKTYAGTGSVMESIAWDGTSDSGKRCPDGSYTAHLTAINKTGAKANASSLPFVCDTIAPRFDLSVAPAIFSPDGDGVQDKATISLAVPTGNEDLSWKISVLDRAASTISTWDGTKPPKPIVWDGKTDEGELVLSAEVYSVVAEVTDAAGNVGTKRATLRTDLIILRQGKKLKIVVPSILFAGESSDYRAGDKAQVARNLEVIDMLVEALSKFPEYRITVEGFAAHVTGTDAKSRTLENKTELLPLSQSRADAIRAALVERGIPARNIKAVGRGSADPLVPVDDKVNQWKNRRVEFILEK